MRVLFVGLRWDYKDPGRGDSFEYSNFFRTLERMADVDAELFPFDALERSVGRREMNKLLVKQVTRENYDLVFFFLFEEEFEPSSVDDVSGHTTTFNWFADDHWRFHTFSKRWAAHFTWIGSTDLRAVAEYERLGQRNVIPTQWGCNHWLFRPVETRRDIDISFVGQPHGWRREAIEILRRAGCKVETWGQGWPAGRLETNEMISLFSRTKVNLNFSEASQPGMTDALKFLIRPHGRFTLDPRSIRDNLKALGMKKRRQLKARNFEITGCRSFLLTGAVEDLGRCFDIGDEIEQFESSGELVEKCRAFVSDDIRREEMATAAYERVLKEHTYEKRFQDIFAVLQSS